MKDKLKSKGFWIAAAGAAIMLLQLLGIKINVPYVNEIVNAVCALMIVLGLMTDDTKKQNDENTDPEAGADNEDTKRAEGVPAEASGEDTGAFAAVPANGAGRKTDTLPAGREKHTASERAGETLLLAADGEELVSYQVAGTEKNAEAGTADFQGKSAAAVKSGMNTAEAADGAKAVKITRQTPPGQKLRLAGFLNVEEATEEEIKNTIDTVTAPRKRKKR